MSELILTCPWSLFFPNTVFECQRLIYRLCLKPHRLVTLRIQDVTSSMIALHCMIVRLEFECTGLRWRSIIFVDLSKMNVQQFFFIKKTRISCWIKYMYMFCSNTTVRFFIKPECPVHMYTSFCLPLMTSVYPVMVSSLRYPFVHPFIYIPYMWYRVLVNG
jgi:hypothetical protein